MYMHIYVNMNRNVVGREDLEREEGNGRSSVREEWCYTVREGGYIVREGGRVLKREGGCYSAGVGGCYSEGEGGCLSVREGATVRGGS